MFVDAFRGKRAFRLCGGPSARARAPPSSRGGAQPWRCRRLSRRRVDDAPRIARATLGRRRGRNRGVLRVGGEPVEVRDVDAHRGALETRAAPARVLAREWAVFAKRRPKRARVLCNFVPSETSRSRTLQSSSSSAPVEIGSREHVSEHEIGPFTRPRHTLAWSPRRSASPPRRAPRVARSRRAARRARRREGFCSAPMTSRSRSARESGGGAGVRRRRRGGARGARAGRSRGARAGARDFAPAQAPLPARVAATRLSYPLCFTRASSMDRVSRSALRLPSLTDRFPRHYPRHALLQVATSSPLESARLFVAIATVADPVPGPERRRRRQLAQREPRVRERGRSEERRGLRHRRSDRRVHRPQRHPRHAAVNGNGWKSTRHRVYGTPRHVSLYGSSCAAENS